MENRNLQNAPVVRAINRFMTTPAYIVLVLLLIMLANDAGWELQIYTVLLTVGCYICLLGDDLLPLMPIVSCCYISVSAKNNPGVYENTVFSLYGWYIALILVPFLLCLVYRLCTDRNFGGKRFFAKKRQLLPGLVILGIAYILGGLFSPAYPTLWKKNVLFSLLQFATLAVPYYLFSGAVDWKKAPKDYFPWIGFTTGGMLVLQLLRIYFHRQVVTKGMIIRAYIYTGWGMHNNIGCFLAMMIPFAFYLAYRYRKGWIGAVAGSLFMLGVVFSCSRSAILVGGCMYLLCIVLLMISTKNKKVIVAIITAFILAIILAVCLFYKELYRLFQSLRVRGFDPNNRNHIYKAGLKQFLQYPIFGGSFYPIDFVPYDFSTVDKFSSFMPPRWHNTVVQLLASTGIIGLAAYVYHRLQTIRVLFLQDRTKEKIYIAFSMAVLLGCSLLDCHFFNMGPAIFYSVGLAFGECCVKQETE